jgi:hypothetical protein
MQIMKRPPMAPPTIAPMFVDSCLEEVGIGYDVEDAKELDVDPADVTTSVGVGCDIEMVKEIPGTGVGLDNVVVADAAFGDGKSLKVPASAPQAMYS